MLGFDLDSAASLRRFQDQFEDLGRIGAGGFSTVHKVRNKRDHKMYALKTVKIKPSSFKAEIAEYLEKVLGQAKILCNLRHPNVLQYHGCWVNADLKTEPDSEEEQQFPEDEEEIELVMEEYSQSSYGFQFEKRSSSIEKKKKLSKINQKSYKQNPSDNIFGTDLLKYKEIRVYLLSQLGDHSLQKYVILRNQKQRKTPFQRHREAISNYKIILDVIEGLTYIHNQKVIHRDIKLQNIVINDRNECKIIDFGLAKKVRNLKSLTFDKFNSEVMLSLDDEDEKHSSSVGTKIFSSPEQTNSSNYDHRTDIYSLAMVIGVLLSDYKTAHEEGELLLNLRSKNLENLHIDHRLKILLGRCLGQQKYRPQLVQLKNCVKTLLKEEILSGRENEWGGVAQSIPKMGKKTSRPQLVERDLQVEC